MKKRTWLFCEMSKRREGRGPEKGKASPLTDPTTSTTRCVLKMHYTYINLLTNYTNKALLTMM